MDRLDVSRGFLMRSGAGYVMLVFAVVALAHLGVFPGKGEVFAGDNFFDHPYRVSMAAVSLVLAVYLGMWTAMVGVSMRSALWGLMALGGGIVFTVGVLELAPYILYPHDQYPVGFMFVMGGAPAAILAWMVGSVLGRGVGGGAEPAGA